MVRLIISKPCTVSGINTGQGDSTGTIIVINLGTVSLEKRCQPHVVITRGVRYLAERVRYCETVPGAAALDMVPLAHEPP